MNEQIVGDAVIHGIRSTGSQITGYTGITLDTGAYTGYVSFIIDRLEATHMGDKYKLKNELGFDISGVSYNERVEITVDFTPAAATRAIALTIPGFPLIFTTMTIANCAVAGTFYGSSAQIFNGNYIYEGDARIMQQNGQVLKLTGLKLTQYGDAAQNAIMNRLVLS